MISSTHHGWFTVAGNARKETQWDCGGVGPGYDCTLRRLRVVGTEGRISGRDEQ